MAEELAAIVQERVRPSPATKYVTIWHAVTRSANWPNEGEPDIGGV